MDNNIDEIFNRHLEAKSKYNCEFNESSVNANKIMLEKFKNEGHIDKNFYVSDKELDLDDNNDDNFIEKDNIHSDYFDNVLEINKEHPYLYCGYLDKVDKYEVQNNSIKDQITCALCFTIIPVKIIKQKSNSFYICEKLDNDKVFKDFLNSMTIDEISQLSGISKDNEIFKDYLECKEKCFIPIKCNSCDNIIGFVNSYSNEKIIYNCM